MGVKGGTEEGSYRTIRESSLPPATTPGLYLLLLAYSYEEKRHTLPNLSRYKLHCADTL